MKRTIKSIPRLTLALVCLACQASSAQAQQPANGKFGFAIHQPGISGPSVWTWLPESGQVVKVLDCSTYPHDAHWDIVHANELRPSILEIKFAVAENAIVFSVTAEYGERFRAIGTSVESGPLPQAFSMGSYMVAETKSIILGSMIDVGLPPLVIDFIVTPAGHAATLSGRVTDATGRSLAKVTLQLSSAHSAQEGVSPRPYTTTTAGDGSYSFAQLEPGPYILQALLPGYAKAEGVLNLTAGQQKMDVNIMLVGQISILPTVAK